VASIAQKYRISTVALARANGIERNAELDEGTRLVLPLAPGSESSLQRVHERVSRHAVRYRVRSGDTLELLADRFDVSSYQIRKWNHLKSEQLVPGNTLLVYTVGSGTVSHRSRPLGKTSAKSTGKKNTSVGKLSPTQNHPKPSVEKAPQPVRAAR
jgi:membrane-bound lytic murein transglycosylase D